MKTIVLKAVSLSAQVRVLDKAMTMARILGRDVSSMNRRIGTEVYVNIAKRAMTVTSRKLTIP